MSSLPTPPVPKAMESVSGKDAEEIAKKAAPEAVLTLRNIMGDESEKSSVRIAAATEILNRALGKSAVHTDTTVNYTVVINQINRARGKVIDVTPADN